MLWDVWTLVKIQLCWWHLQKAVWEQLAKNKLSTTPYNAKHAKAEFGFIDIVFAPTGWADPHEYKGGIYNIVADINKDPPSPSPNTITFTIKPWPKSKPLHNLQCQAASSNIGSSTKLPTESKMKAKVSEAETDKEDVSDGVKGGRRWIFCPEQCHQLIVDMMETHLCAHLLIPGYSHTSPEGIREWAVKEIYNTRSLLPNIHFNCPYDTEQCRWLGPTKQCWWNQKEQLSANYGLIRWLAFALPHWTPVTLSSGSQWFPTLFTLCSWPLQPSTIVLKLPPSPLQWQWLVPSVSAHFIVVFLFCIAPPNV